MTAFPARATALALVLASATLAACGDEPAPPPEPTVPQATVPSPVTEQIAALKTCLGGKPVTRVDIFEPTYQFVRSNGGGGFAIKLDKQQIQFFVLPTVEAAATAQEDAQNQLIALQQTDPDAYATVAATAMQAFGNVLEIVPTGPPGPDAADTIARCATESAAPAPES